MYVGFGKRVILSGTEIFEKIQGADLYFDRIRSRNFQEFPIKYSSSKDYLPCWV